MTQTTPTDRKMPFESQEEYEAACKAVEGKPMTPYQPHKTLEEREFALAYQIEKCLDMKFDSAELGAVRKWCRRHLEDAFNAGMDTERNNR